MRSDIPAKMLAIAEEVRAGQNLPVTKLTILKKWFAECPTRLPAVTVWAAARATSRRGNAEGEEAELFEEARYLLADHDEIEPRLDEGRAAALHRRLREYQNEHVRQKFYSVRQIKNWQLFIIELALDIYLWRRHSPSDGYMLIAKYMGNYDPHVGTGLNGPSANKLDEFARFLFVLEAREEGEDE